MFGRAWPVPRTAGCDVILEWAIKHGVLLLPQRTQALWAQRYPTRASHWRQMDGAPMHGDLFLTMAHPGDATHVGVVDEARDDESFSTGECNANAAGSREGNAITTLPRRNHATDTRVYALVRWQGMIR